MEGLDWFVDYRNNAQSKESIACSSNEDAVRVARYFAFLYGEATLTPKAGGNKQLFKRGQLNPVMERKKK